jgi:hypothetical protein
LGVFEDLCGHRIPRFRGELAMLVPFDGSLYAYRNQETDSNRKKVQKELTSKRGALFADWF